jgi:undecaprenyl-diphosphatase
VTGPAKWWRPNKTADEFYAPCCFGVVQSYRVPMKSSVQTAPNGFVAFLRRRLSPKEYLGLRLTVGMVVLVIACGIFGEITEDVYEGGAELQVDMDVTNYFHARATPGMISAMKGVSFMGSTLFLSVATVIVAVAVAVRKRWHQLVMLGLVVPGGAILNIAVKNVIHRERPVLEHPIVTLTSYSFPSGHTSGSMLFYGLMAIFAMTSTRRRAVHVAAFGAGAGIVALVGFSRIYLGAHYLSDVLGAMAAGAAWLALCVTAVDTYFRRAEHRRNSSRSALSRVRS